QAWPEAGVRGGFWSVRWNGTITIPKEHSDLVTFHIDSSGPSSLVINGEKVLVSEEKGEVKGDVTLESGVPHEIGLTYSNMRVPRSFFKLYWSVPGRAKEPVPSDWLGYRKEDHSAAIVYSEREGVEQTQLERQSDALIERVAESRAIYEDFLRQWESEKKARN
ncbi:MAG: hypothetical protein HN763_00705, partial [Opitutales bacterium]|nr:hypothetical protein [Opitutales bacterium]